MADDNTIIEGAVKFREGKKWKSRWCVLRKLSPVADCVQLEVWRDARARAGRAAGGLRAALALAGWVGAEAGFALDQHSHTLALLCRDAAAALAFDSPERLLHWQVKVATHVGPSRYYLVQVAAAPAAAPRGPARLHVAPRRAALSAGAPPKLLAVWEIAHLRRYGVIEGRFCLEGGALSGRGEGLFVLVTDRAHDIARDFDRAARGKLSPRDRRYTIDGDRRPLSSLRLGDGARTPGPRRATEAPPPGSRAAAAAADEYDEPYWPSSERVQSPDAASLGGARAEGEAVALARCVSCMSKLGAMARSTAGGSPPRGHFRPAWTMEGLAAAARGEGEDCLCPPARPPKPRRDPPVTVEPVPTTPGVGPYENYDVPKMPFEEVSRMVDEYYDTPKRLKDCLNDELFRMTRSSTTDSLVLKKSCGCLLKVGRRRAGSGLTGTGTGGAVGMGEGAAPCACQRVTAWAHSWMRLPLCRREDKENEPDALYATVDLARKRRPRLPHAPCPARVAVDDGPLANYENLSFALSLEHYENAKDVLKRAGVTQTELDALRAHIDPTVSCACGRCGTAGGEAGDYLLMRPPARPEPPAGYTPMSPLAPAPHSLQRPPRPAPPAPPARSASHPALCEAAGAGDAGHAGDVGARRRRGRCSSADSSRFLDDDDEALGGERGSSTETLRRAPHTLQDADISKGGVTEIGQVVIGGGGNRDSSSSNDSGVSSSSRSRAVRRRPPRPRARSSGPPAPARPAPRDTCSSAEAAVPVLTQPRRGPADSRSTSSGASDMSDYIETLSLCSSHSSTDTPDTMRVVRQTTSTLRPRSGKEYQALSPRAAPPAPAPAPAPSLKSAQQRLYDPPP